MTATRTILLRRCANLIAASVMTCAFAQVIHLPAKPARSIADFQQLLQNTGKLAVALTLDRQEYFPGEDAELTVTITNNGSAPVEVLEPFYPGNGRVNIYIRDRTRPVTDPSSWRIANLDESAEIDRDAPAVWLPPGQSRSVKFVMSDPAHSTAVDSHGRLSVTVCSICGTPEDEGEYEYRYNYGAGGHVGFKVVWPQFEQWTQVRLAKDAQYEDHQGRVFSNVPRLVRFAVLGYQNSHVIVASVNPKTGGPPRPDPSGKLTGSLSRYFGTYRRIASSSVPVTSLQVTADNAENITLTHTDQTGRSFSLKLNANRDLVP